MSHSSSRQTTGFHGLPIVLQGMLLKIAVATIACLLIGWDTSARGQAIELFDGKTLAGFDGEPDRWSVENGCIVGTIAAGTTLKHNTWLVVKQSDLADFELKFRFKISGGATANSGVQVRSQVTDVRHVAGYQCDLDAGTTWLGRIYDEHGRALLVERGSRVRIDEKGVRQSKAFAPASQYKVLFREEGWNEYRIVAVGPQIDVYVNGTLFSQLEDHELGARDLSGQIAFQLHSGGHTRVEFKDLTLEKLTPKDSGRLQPMEFDEKNMPQEKRGDTPQTLNGSKPNFSFELGNLSGWTTTGDAFDGQPVQQDGIAARWPGQTSGKDGSFFIGGFELKRDKGVGTLTSPQFQLTHPYCGFRLGGGNDKTTRVELVGLTDSGAEEILHTSTGNNQEQMRLVAIDVRSWQGRTAFIRVVDESKGGWGHINFDDIRLYREPPAELETISQWRSTFNPVLQHLVKNKVEDSELKLAGDTLNQMFVPSGFSVHCIASEPAIHQPIAFAFDARGRIWVVEGHSYPEGRPEGQGLDQIVILSDEDSNGSFESRKVFAKGLNLVSGIEIGHGGVWIGASPYLMFIEDRNQDDVPDGPPEVLLDGFSYADTHETLNSFMWGPDGWLYGTHGVFNSSMIGKPGTPDRDRIPLHAGVWRYHPTKHSFEVFAHGGSNPWGLDYDQHGQIFMTHCRSYWGKGLTTHVMQGGHFWNQVNSGYPSFVIPHDVTDMPEMKNYLLASARYGHGEGGAGKPGTNEVYGGHSHVGTMIYLGNNWPGKYHNHLFTLNLHGHQMNQQINLREAGGYDTVHAGEDVFFCADQQFIGVDLQVGPDGAVYISDWYDPRHCHNPNIELWDRGNGRIYRMQFDATYRPAKPNLVAASDLDLAKAQLHENDWHARVARRLLAERSSVAPIRNDAIAELRTLLKSSASTAHRLRALWTLHGIKALDAESLVEAIQDSDEYIAAWGVQLAAEVEPAKLVCDSIVRQAFETKSLLVRRYLASSVSRLPTDVAWNVLEALVSQPENELDRDLPKLIWHGLAPMAANDWERAGRLAERSKMNSIADYLNWYRLQQNPQDAEERIARIGSLNPEQQRRMVQLIALAIGDARGLTPTSSWSKIGSALYDSSDPVLRNASQRIGAAYADPSLFAMLRESLVAGSLTDQQQANAIDTLAADSSPKNIEIFLGLLDNPKLAGRAIAALRRYGDDSIPSNVLKRIPNWDANTNAQAIELLASRPTWALSLMDHIKNGTVRKDLVTAYHVRLMTSLGSESLNQRLADEWGRVREGSGELKAEIRKTIESYETAPLWAFSSNAGAAQFQKLCGNCHKSDQAGIELAPKLEGTSAKGIGYLVENIIDPNAVIGKGYQATVIATVDGQVLNGIVQGETASSITLRTATETVTINKSDIEDTKVSQNSFMPLGLLNSLNDRERIELLKYLMSL